MAKDAPIPKLGGKVGEARRDRVAPLIKPPTEREIPAFWQHAQYSSYGFFNPIKRRSLDISYDTTNYNFLQTVGEASKNVFQHNALATAGPFIAIVLRVDVAPAGQTAASLGQTGYEPSRKNSISTSIFGTDGTPDPVKLNKGDKVFYEVKARVNELEVLPWPWDQNDDYIINEYPTFVAERELSETVIRVGDLIWVDFTNTREGLQGIILEKIDIEPGDPPSPAWAPPRYQPKIPCCAPSRPKGAKIKTAAAKIPRSPTPSKSTQPKSGGHIVMIKGQKSLQSTGYAIYHSLIEGGAPAGKCFWGHIEGNGGTDHADRPSDCGRETLIYVPDTFDNSKPYEMAYYFHGLRGFGKMYRGNKTGATPKIDKTLKKGDFYYRMTKWLRKMVNEQKRNFVLVFPELSWSTGFGQTGPQKRGRAGARAYHHKRRVYWSFSHAKAPYAWQAGGINKPHGIHDDDFVKFHNNVIATLASLGVRELDQSGQKDVLSWTGHSAGGHLLSSLVTNKEVMTQIKPNRITLSDCDYGTATPGNDPEKPTGWATAWNVYNMYIKSTAPYYPGKDHWLEMNVFAVPYGKQAPGRNAKHFFKNTPGIASKGKKFKFVVGEKPKHIFPNGEVTGPKQYVTWHPAKTHDWSALHSFTFLNENAPGTGSTPTLNEGNSSETETANDKAAPAGGGESKKTGPARAKEIEATQEELQKKIAKSQKALLEDEGFTKQSLASDKIQQSYTKTANEHTRTAMQIHMQLQNQLKEISIEKDLIDGIDPSAFKGDLNKEQMQKQIEKLEAAKANLQGGKTPEGKSAAGTIYDKQNVVKSKIRLIDQQIKLLKARKKAHNDAPDINNTNCRDCSDESAMNRGARSWKTWAPSSAAVGAPASRLIGEEAKYASTQAGKKYDNWYYGFGNTKSSLFPIHLNQPNPGNPDDFPNGAGPYDAGGHPVNYPTWLIQKWCPRNSASRSGRGPRHIYLGKTNPNAIEGNMVRGLMLFACLEIIERYWKQGIKIVGGPHDGIYNDAEILISSHYRKNGNGNHKFNGAADFQVRFDNRKKSLPGMFIWAGIQILQKTYRIPVGGAGAYLQANPDSGNRIRGVNYYDQGKVVRGLRGGKPPGSYSHNHYDVRGHFDYGINRRRGKGMHLAFSHWICTDLDSDGAKDSGYNQVQGMGRDKQMRAHLNGAANAGQENEAFKFLKNVFHRNGHENGQVDALQHNGKDSKFLPLGHLNIFPKDFQFPLVGGSIPNLNQLCGLGNEKNTGQYYWNGHSGGNPAGRGKLGQSTETKKEKY